MALIDETFFGDPFLDLRLLRTFRSRSFLFSRRRVRYLLAHKLHAVIFPLAEALVLFVSGSPLFFCRSSPDGEMSTTSLTVVSSKAPCFDRLLVLAVHGNFCRSGVSLHGPRSPPPRGGPTAAGLVLQRDNSQPVPPPPSSRCGCAHRASPPRLTRRFRPSELTIVCRPLNSSDDAPRRLDPDSARIATPRRIGARIPGRRSRLLFAGFRIARRIEAFCEDAFSASSTARHSAWPVY